ncbi:DUF4142 domain-containing protein [Streptomyces antnestii]|uniref:DUF4142 domain-containing protein n=1 Tax=Streptomyces antnestii TaxID=2494256 RepID=A0A3S2VEL9_9ACTN|nr:DUF4142 domain-containing protein [Streptomyces sp. San01]RVU22809.1 DUF4142 domain-containing protein [Streptomyces sp. San01]
MRRINGTALVIAALVATLGALAFPIWSYADRSGTGQADLNAGSVATPWGPLSATDRDFLVKVRLAGLWEIPAGQQAMERAPTRAIRAAGDHLVVGHTDLDARVRSVAGRLGVELPNQPNPQQQGWLRELTAARGKDYENKFANLLRDSHGKVFALVAQVRHTTRNTLVRELATDANQTVLDHITMLENTGDVDFDAIANEAAGTATASPTGPPPPGGAPPPLPSPAGPSGSPVLTSRPSAGSTTDPGRSINTDRPETW